MPTEVEIAIPTVATRDCNCCKIDEPVEIEVPIIATERPIATVAISISIADSIAGTMPYEPYSKPITQHI